VLAEELLCILNTARPEDGHLYSIELTVDDYTYQWWRELVESLSSEKYFGAASPREAQAGGSWAFCFMLLLLFA